MYAMVPVSGSFREQVTTIICRYNNNKKLNGYCAHPGVSTSMTLPAVPMYIVFCWPTCNPRQCFPFNGTLPRATQSASWLPHPETSSRWHSLQSAICECSRYLLLVPKVWRLHFGMGTKTGNLPSQDKIYHPELCSSVLRALIAVHTRQKLIKPRCDDGRKASYLFIPDRLMSLIVYL